MHTLKDRKRSRTKQKIIGERKQYRHKMTKLKIKKVSREK